MYIASFFGDLFVCMFLLLLLFVWFFFYLKKIRYSYYDRLISNWCLNLNCNVSHHFTFDEKDYITWVTFVTVNFFCVTRCFRSTGRFRLPYNAPIGGKEKPCMKDSLYHQSTNQMPSNIHLHIYHMYHIHSLIYCKFVHATFANTREITWIIYASVSAIRFYHYFNRPCQKTKLSYLVFLVILFPEVITKLSIVVIAEAEHIAVCQPNHRMSSSTGYARYRRVSSLGLVLIQSYPPWAKFCSCRVSTKPKAKWKDMETYKCEYLYVKKDKNVEWSGGDVSDKNMIN